MTWWIRGFGSRPRRRRWQRQHRSGRTATTVSGSSRSRLCCLCPGCPPCARPVGSLDCRGAPGGSDDGGFDEFWEVCPRRARSSAFSASSFATRSINCATFASSSAMRASRGSSSDIKEHRSCFSRFVDPIHPRDRSHGTIRHATQAATRERLPDAYTDFSDHRYFHKEDDTRILERRTPAPRGRRLLRRRAVRPAHVAARPRTVSAGSGTSTSTSSYGPSDPNPSPPQPTGRAAERGDRVKAVC